MTWMVNAIEIDLRLRKIWLSIGYALLSMTAVLSLIPIPGPDIGGGDKLVHFVTYALLSGWFSLIVKYSRTLWTVLFGLIAFGFLMEYLQGFTSYRRQDIDDAIANSVGVMVGMAIHFSPLRGLLVKFDKFLHAWI